MKRCSRYSEGFVSAFALIVFVMISGYCSYYLESLRQKMEILKNLEKIRDDTYKEYALILTFDRLIKTYEPPVTDEESEELIDVDTKIMIDDFYIDGDLVEVLNGDDHYILSYDDLCFRIFADEEGVISYEAV